MGFWHTGYEDFHQHVGWDKDLFPTGPRPVVYLCQHCDAEFDNDVDLRAHRFEEHPVNRPVLFIDGKEVGGAPFHVSSRLSATDISAAQCSTAVVNGRTIEIGELGELLASVDNDRLFVGLSNRDTSADFVVEIEVARPEDIDGVELAFQSIVAGKRLDLRTVEDFISATRRYHSAARYFDGVCEYLYGVMARERSPESNLMPGQYVEKYNRASDLLDGMDRPLARLIRGLVAFHLNHFDIARRVASGSRLAIAANRYFHAIDKASFVTKLSDKSGNKLSLDRLLSDWDTEKVLSWSLKSIQDISSSTVELESLLATLSGNYDGLKIRLLLCYAYKYSGDTRRAQDHARTLRNDPSVGDWSEFFLQTL